MPPTLYITNWSSRSLRGPGRSWSIMAAPRTWEHGDGTVAALVPHRPDLLLVKAGKISMAEYRKRYLARLGAIGWLPLEPGQLCGRMDTHTGDLVRDGDTLLCACSREAASKCECHRVWAAELLIQAGWRVVLDGQEADEYSLRCLRDRCDAAAAFADANDGIAGVTVVARGDTITLTAMPVGSTSAEP